MKIQRNSLIHQGTAAALVAAMGFSLVVGPAAGTAQASAKGRRNTTIAAGAATAYSLLKGKKKAALLGGLGTAYAYKRYRDAKKSERRQTIGQVFGNTPVYDSKGHRYAQGTRFIPNRVYYNARGQRVG